MQTDIVITGTIAFLSLLMPIFRWVFKARLDQLRRKKEYEFPFGLVTGILWFAWYACAVYFGKNRIPYDKHMYDCCHHKVETFRHGTMNHLTAAQTTLADPRSFELFDFKELKDNHLIPLNNLGKRVSEEFGFQKFDTVHAEINKNLSTYENESKGFEQFMQILKSSAGNDTKCGDKIDSNTDLFKISYRVSQLKQFDDSEFDVKGDIITSQISTIRKGDYMNETNQQVQEVEKFTKYVDFNLNSLKLRVNESLENVNAPKSNPLIERKEMSWVKISHILFYAFITVLGLLSTFTVSIPVTLDLYEKENSFAEKVITVGFGITIMVCLMICGTLCALVHYDVINATADCSNDVKKAFQAPYEFRLMDENHKMVEKSFDSVCDSPTASFFSDFDIPTVFSTDSATRNSNFEAFSSRILSKMTPNNFQNFELPAEFKSETGKILELVDLIEELLKMKCTDGQNRIDLEKYQEQYRDLVQMIRNYEQVVSNMNNWNVLAKSILDKEVAVVTSRMSSLMNETLEKAEKSDFSCQSIAESSFKCVRADEQERTHFFFRCLCFLAFYTVISQFLFNPWTIPDDDEEDEDDEE